MHFVYVMHLDKMSKRRINENPLTNAEKCKRYRQKAKIISGETEYLCQDRERKLKSRDQSINHQIYNALFSSTVR